MFGTWSSPCFKLKGAETNYFMEFLVGAMPRFREALKEEFDPMLQSGRCLMDLLSSIRAHPMTMPATAIQNFYNSAQRYLYLMYTVLGLAAKPKDHMLVHMSYDIPAKGSPALYGCWLDESINRILRDCASGAHALNHDRRILAEFPTALALLEKTRQTRRRTG